MGIPVINISMDDRLPDLWSHRHGVHLGSVGLGFETLWEGSVSQGFGADPTEIVISQSNSIINMAASSFCRCAGALRCWRQTLCKQYM